MLEANPNLGLSRNVKHILVRTAAKNDPGDLGWTNNAAGPHNQPQLWLRPGQCYRRRDARDHLVECGSRGGCVGRVGH